MKCIDCGCFVAIEFNTWQCYVESCQAWGVLQGDEE